MTRKSCLGSLTAACLASLALVHPAAAAGKLALYNWSIYIDPQVVEDFSKETGIATTLDNYGNNEEMLAKIQAGATGYDIVFPSVHMQDIMTSLDLLQPVGLQSLKGHENIDDRYFRAKTDLDHQNCMPYNWGSTGLLVNKAMTAGQEVDTWKVVFDPPEALKGKIAMLDDVRETVGAALIYNGFSINSTDPKELAKARDTIIKAKPYWAAMLTDGIGDKVVNGDFAVAQWWSGSAAQTVDTAKDKVEYVLPREGVNGFQEDMCLLKSAPNVAEAKLFFEYMMRPEVSAKNTNWLRGGSPNKAAMPLIDKGLTENKALYPDEATFKLFNLVQDLGDGIRLWDAVWTKVKAD
ncbi:PotD/PotF family extracellular solute-binding protein [Pleomorphomonas sp. JP5]|uniref:ABC transporter substrate-binding protein n=1 Tax=Pleomorphomonas sp. JP5 TaxID=2942998 RepID=UPI002043392C|nr:spermidine/putrescine ABC transporter substrate-binding protein [Pleomorphomonas sp. JP5]MCM5557715.1 spermidine/putrescine ABC transporter substrate-binding protein [Pleomorphomonas sp. JP5]